MRWTMGPTCKVKKSQGAQTTSEKGYTPHVSIRERGGLLPEGVHRASIMCLYAFQYVFLA